LRSASSIDLWICTTEKRNGKKSTIGVIKNFAICHLLRISSKLLCLLFYYQNSQSPVDRNDATGVSLNAMITAVSLAASISCFHVRPVFPSRPDYGSYAIDRSDRSTFSLEDRWEACTSHFSMNLTPSMPFMCWSLVISSAA